MTKYRENLTKFGASDLWMWEMLDVVLVILAPVLPMRLLPPCLGGCGAAPPSWAVACRGSWSDPAWSSEPGCGSAGCCAPPGVGRVPGGVGTPPAAPAAPAPGRRPVPVWPIRAQHSTRPVTGHQRSANTPFRVRFWPTLQLIHCNRSS